MRIGPYEVDGDVGRGGMVVLRTTYRGHLPQNLTFEFVGFRVARSTR